MTTKEFAIKCIENARGDDLYRAQMSFNGLSEESMKKQHGQSGRTRQQVLDGYLDHNDQCEAAIALCRERL